MRYKEIIKLKEMLDNNSEVDIDFVFVFVKKADGYHICSADFSIANWKGWSVIESEYSYGADKDLLEIAGEILTDNEEIYDGFNVVGNVSAEEAYRRIIKYEKNRRI